MLFLVMPAQPVQIDVIPQLEEHGVVLLQVIQAQILVTLDAAHHLVPVQIRQHEGVLPVFIHYMGAPHF